MVKGVTKQIVVLEMQDNELFEQAIFIVNPQYGRGRSSHDVLREAKRITAECVSKGKSKIIKNVPAPFFAAAGAAVTAIAWLAVRLIGI